MQFPRFTLLLLNFFLCGLMHAQNYSFEISVRPTAKENAPALQSFVHGVEGGEWLLFGGRTNSSPETDDGGLHSIDSNYTNQSFPPLSFNSHIYVYNVQKDTLWKVSICKFLKGIYSKFEKEFNYSLFMNTNALVTQYGDSLYWVGGYGPQGFDKAFDHQNQCSHCDIVNCLGPVGSNYKTYNQIAKLNVSKTISMVKAFAGETSASIPATCPISVGKNKKLVATGGELFYANDSLYLAGGWRFGSNPSGYVNCVYPFKATEDTTNNTLTIVTGKPISNIPVDSLNTEYADKYSLFRRRDAPITHALFKKSSGYTSGMIFYGGVFRFGHPLAGWNDAIYVSPQDKDQRYLLDPIHNQKNYNIYACSEFVAYDSSHDTLHTFLLGGIGDGTTNSHLSGFTNSGLHNRLHTESRTTAADLGLIKNVFGCEKDKFYGAESAPIPIQNPLIKYMEVNGKTTEVIDLNNTFSEDCNKYTVSGVAIGYVYGGIVSFEKNPHTYGPQKSAASHKIWEVILKQVKAP